MKPNPGTEPQLPGTAGNPSQERERAVVLEIGGKKLVVSPDRPTSFLRALSLDPKAGTPDP